MSQYDMYHQQDEADGQQYEQQGRFNNERDLNQELEEALRRAIKCTRECQPLEVVEDLLYLNKLNQIERKFRKMREEKRNLWLLRKNRKKMEEVLKKMEMHETVMDGIIKQRNEQAEMHQGFIELIQGVNSGASTMPSDYEGLGHQNQPSSLGLRGGSNIYENRATPGYSGDWYHHQLYNSRDKFPQQLEQQRYAAE